MKLLTTIKAFFTGFSEERRILRAQARIARLQVTAKNVQINELEREVKRLKRVARINRHKTSSQLVLAEALDRYNKASRARVYPGGDSDKMSDKIRLLRRALTIEMARADYMAENLVVGVVPWDELPSEVKERMYQEVEGSI
jgi:hypothetical protein